MLLTEIGPNLNRSPPPRLLLMVEALPRPKDQRRSGPILTNPSNQEPSSPRTARGYKVATPQRLFLGDYFRRMKACMGTPKAMTATANKLARIIFHMITTNNHTTPLSFKSRKSAGDTKNRPSFTHKPENSRSNSSPSMLFLRRAGGFRM